MRLGAAQSAHLPMLKTLVGTLHGDAAIIVNFKAVLFFKDFKELLEFHFHAAVRGAHVEFVEAAQAFDEIGDAGASDKLEIAHVDNDLGVLVEEVNAFQMLGDGAGTAKVEIATEFYNRDVVVRRHFDFHIPHPQHHSIVAEARRFVRQKSHNTPQHMPADGTLAAIC
jgi:hypothetical protein